MTLLNAAVRVNRCAVFIMHLYRRTDIPLAACAYVRLQHFTIHLAGTLEEFLFDFMFRSIHGTLRENPLFGLAEFPSRFEVEERHRRLARGIKREGGNLHMTSCMWVPRRYCCHAIISGGYTGGFLFLRRLPCSDYAENMFIRVVGE